MLVSVMMKAICDELNGKLSAVQTIYLLIVLILPFRDGYLIPSFRVLIIRNDRRHI